MFAKGFLHNSGRRLASYFMREEEGERVELVEVRGFASEDIHEAFRSIDAMAQATKAQKPMFHVSVRNPPGENLTREQWLETADRLEAKLGLSDQPRAIVFHTDTDSGDTHMHIGWSRIDEETMTVREVPFFKLRLKECCRELEREFGITEICDRRAGKTQSPTQDEEEQAYRLGLDPNKVRETIRDCWERSDNGRSFQVALEFEGLRLARGDRRDFVVVDQQGGVTALGKRILGVSAAEIRERCADIDRKSLPSVEEARHEQRTGMRDEHAANRAWEDALASAGIAAAASSSRPAEEPRFTANQYELLAPVILDEVTRNRATFTRFDIQRQLESRLERQADREAMAQAILERPEVISLKAGKGRGARFTTSSVLEAEGYALQGAEALSGHDWHGVPETLLNKKLNGLTGEKAEALKHILGSAGLALLDGQAGTGKSTVLAAAREIYAADQCRVIGLAHTNLVVQDLKTKGFDARTIDSELYSLAQGRTEWSNRTVVMVDEAAMVDTRRLGMIFAHAQESGAKVILAGDDRQLSSIERGGLFEVLKRQYGAAELKDVHRQQSNDDRAASQMMANGNFSGALATYAAKGAIHWSGLESEAATALVAKYMQDSAADPAKGRFIFAYTNTEVTQMNAVVREARKARGELGDASSFETKHGRAEFAVGDRMQFTGTDKRQGIYNGQAGTVSAIDGSQITVTLDGRSKAIVRFDAAEFKDSGMAMPARSTGGRAEPSNKHICTTLSTGGTPAATSGSRATAKRLNSLSLARPPPICPLSRARCPVWMNVAPRLITQSKTGKRGP